MRMRRGLKSSADVLSCFELITRLITRSSHARCMTHSTQFNPTNWYRPWPHVLADSKIDIGRKQEMRSFCAAFVLGTIVHCGTAFTITTTVSVSGSALSATTNTDGVSIDRRSLFGKVAAAAAVSTGVSAAAGFPLPAFAAGAPPTEADIQRLKKG